LCEEDKFGKKKGQTVFTTFPVLGNMKKMLEEMVHLREELTISIQP